MLSATLEQAAGEAQPLTLFGNRADADARHCDSGISSAESVNSTTFCASPGYCIRMSSTAQSPPLRRRKTSSP